MKKKIIGCSIVMACFGLGYLAGKVGLGSEMTLAFGLIVGAIYWLAVRVAVLGRENGKLKGNIDRLERVNREMRMKIDYVEREAIKSKSRLNPVHEARQRLQSWEEFIGGDQPTTSARAGATTCLAPRAST